MIREDLTQLMSLVRSYAFPEQFPGGEGLPERLRELGSRYTDRVDEWMTGLDEVAALLQTDVDAIVHIDPAVDDRDEVILCYPAVTAMLHYRVAHLLLGLGIRIIPRMLTELAHAETGIDIHPAAQIGPWFAIDHGTGVVIGQTTVIGEHVTLYQGVTLGARNFSYGADGKPLDIPRHPILEDGVTVYSNSSILGRVTIGRGSVIGGNVWLTSDVPPGSRILQSKAVYLRDFTDGDGI